MLFWVVPHLLNGLSLFVHNASSNSALIWSYLSWPINFTLSPVATQQASRSSCMQMRVDFYSIGLRLIYFLCCVHNRLSFRGWIAHVLFSKKLRKSMRLQFLNLCKFDLRSIYYCTSFFFLFFFYSVNSLFSYFIGYLLLFALLSFWYVWPVQNARKKCMTLHND